MTWDWLGETIEENPLHGCNGGSQSTTHRIRLKSPAFFTDLCLEGNFPAIDLPDAPQFPHPSRKQNGAADLQSATPWIPKKTH
jgi:hypothetical protein